MNQSIKRGPLPRAEEGHSCLQIAARLQHDRFTKRVVAVHEPIVAFVQAGDELMGGFGREFATLTLILGESREYEFTDVVRDRHLNPILEHPCKDKVHIDGL